MPARFWSRHEMYRDCVDKYDFPQVGQLRAGGRVVFEPPKHYFGWADDGERLGNQLTRLLMTCEKMSYPRP
jgi:hypothetical protein